MAERHLIWPWGPDKNCSMERRRTKDMEPTFAPHLLPSVPWAINEKCTHS